MPVLGVARFTTRHWPLVQTMAGAGVGTSGPSDVGSVGFDGKSGSCKELQPSCAEFHFHKTEKQVGVVS